MSLSAEEPNGMLGKQKAKKKEEATFATLDSVKELPTGVETPASAALKSVPAPHGRGNKDRWDWAIASVCISAGIIGLRTVNDSVLWSQFTSGTSHKQVIGTLIKKKGGVRFRSSASPLWHDVYSGSEPVSVGDTVFTSDDGVAELRLKDGSVAEVEPNSLIVVQLSSEVLPEQKGWSGALESFFATKAPESLLKIERGGAKVDLRANAAPIRLQIKGKVYNLSSRAGSGAAKVSVDSNPLTGEGGAKFASASDLGVELSEATAAGELPAQEVQVGKGEEAVLALESAGAARLKVQTVKLNPVAPAAGEQLLLDPETPVGFSWQWSGSDSAAPASQLELEGAGVPEAAKALAVGAGQANTRVTLPPGAYRWRVSATAPVPGEARTETQWQSFRLVTLVPPQPVGPLEGAWIMLPRGEALANVLFSWQAPPSGLLPEIEWSLVSDDPAKPGVPTHHVGDELSAGWQTRLAVGTYEWRARARSTDGGRQSPWSAPHRFTVRYETPLPKSGEEASAANAMPPPSVILSGPGAPPAGAVPGAGALSADPAVLGAEAANAARLEAEAVARAKAAIKKPRILTVKATSSSTSLAGSSERLDQLTVPLSWAKLPDAERYELTVIEAATGKNVLKEKTEEPSFDWKIESLETTRFRYLVTAITESGERISSAPILFEIQMSAPVLKRPASGARLAPSKSGAILLTWQSTVLTEYYLLQISTDPTFKKKDRAEQVSSNLYIVRGLKSDATYYWRVQSYAHGHASAWSDPGKFTLEKAQP